MRRNHTNISNTDGYILSEEKSNSPHLTLQQKRQSQRLNSNQQQKNNDNDTKPFIVWQAM